MDENNEKEIMDEFDDVEGFNDIEEGSNNLEVSDKNIGKSVVDEFDDIDDFNDIEGDKDKSSDQSPAVVKVPKIIQQLKIDKKHSYTIVFGNVFSDENKIIDEKIINKNLLKKGSSKVKKEKDKKKKKGATEHEPSVEDESIVEDKNLEESREKKYLETIGTDISKSCGSSWSINKRGSEFNSIGGKYYLRLSGDNTDYVNKYLNDLGYPTPVRE